ncbi:MAG: FitA-like ribbon-helix-helix domain-containing protein [Nitrospirales bacterium]
MARRNAHQPAAGRRLHPLRKPHRRSPGKLIRHSIFSPPAPPCSAARWSRERPRELAQLLSTCPGPPLPRPEGYDSILLAYPCVACVESFEGECAMPQLLVRDLEAETLKRLKSRAKRHGRSLQGEAKAILEEAATLSLGEAREVAAQWRKRLQSRKFSDSGKLISEDRQR